MNNLITDTLMQSTCCCRNSWQTVLFLHQRWTTFLIYMYPSLFRKYMHASLVLEAKHEFYALICGATRDVAYACRWWNSTCIQWFATLAERSLIQLLGVQQQFGQRKQNTVECCKKSVSTCRQWKVGIKTTKERACRDQDSNLGCHGHNVKY